jgi:putative SOS response-associated peptidase YedK
LALRRPPERQPLNPCHPRLTPHSSIHNSTIQSRGRNTTSSEARLRALIPYWAKDIKIGFATINARAEEIDTKPAFREAFQRRRCLVPLDLTARSARIR